MKNRKQIKSPEFRVAFSAAITPKAGPSGGEPYYNIKMLIPKSADLKPMREIAREAIKEKWSNKVPKGINSPFRDGDTDYENQMDGYAGCTVVGARSNYKPQIIDMQGKEITTEDTETGFYSGCWARAMLGAFAYDRAGNKGVSFQLNSLLKIRNDEPFGGGGRARDDFADDIEDTDETPGEVTEVSKEELFGKGNGKEDNDIPF